MVQRTTFATAECPIARSVDQVGDWWKLLIMRDALDGLTRFDEFEKSLGIAPNMLTRRLAALVEDGLLHKRAYADHPVRHEYVLTARGRALQSVLVTLLAWGNDAVPTGERSVVLTDKRTGEEVTPIVVDQRTGRPVSEIALAASAGPGASPAMLSSFESKQAARHRRSNHVR